MRGVFTGKRSFLPMAVLLLPVLVFRLILCDTTLCPFHKKTSGVEMPCHKHGSQPDKKPGDDCCQNMTFVGSAQQSISLISPALSCASVYIALNQKPSYSYPVAIFENETGPPPSDLVTIYRSFLI